MNHFRSSPYSQQIKECDWLLAHPQFFKGDIAKVESHRKKLVELEEMFIRSANMFASDPRTAKHMADYDKYR